MKQGANYQDRNKIASLAAKGKTAEEISFRLRIVESVVAAFMPDGPNEPEQAELDLDLD